MENLNNKNLSKIKFDSDDFLNISITKSQSSKISSVYVLSIEKLCEYVVNDPNCSINKSDLEKFYVSNHRLELPNKIDSLAEVIIMIILGFINNKSKQLPYFKSIFNQDLPEESFLSESNSCLIYSDYIVNALNHLPLYNFSLEKLKNLKSCLNMMGFSLDEKVFKRIESLIYFNSDKIMIVIAPGDNFWFKSDKACINHQNYERKYDGKDIYVFYNWEFIDNFIRKIGSHPRCILGLVSSLSKTNLKENFELILNQYELKNDKVIDDDDIYLFDEERHDKIETGFDNSNLFLYKRSLPKIIEAVENDFNLSEKKILILESEESKCDSLSDNVIMVNCFSESILRSDVKKKQRINKLIDYLFNYILNMLDTNSPIDVQKYLKENPFIITE